jgi:hypothetical protein
LSKGVFVRDNLGTGAKNMDTLTTTTDYGWNGFASGESDRSFFILFFDLLLMLFRRPLLLDLVSSFQRPSAVVFFSGDTFSLFFLVLGVLFSKSSCLYA